MIFEVGRVIVDRSTLGQSCVVFWPSGQKGGALEKIWSLRLMLATFTGGNGDAGSLISSSEYSFHVSCAQRSIQISASCNIDVAGEKKRGLGSPRAQ